MIALYRLTLPGLASVLESDRIKEEVVNMEHDMWEY